MDEDEEDLSPRQVSRRKIREAGQRSSRTAHAMMLMPETVLRRLVLDEDLRQAFLRARTIKATGARRREERRLAGELRQQDLGQIEEQLSTQQDVGRADARLFQQIEAWRDRLLTGDAAALRTFQQQHPGQDQGALARLIHEANREQLHGKPRGAKKALFRQIATALKLLEPGQGPGAGPSGDDS